MYQPSNYSDRTFSSMTQSSLPGEGYWAVLLDFQEALCYALVVAQNTGLKTKVRKSKSQDGWLVHETRKECKSRPGPAVKTILGSKSPRYQGSV